MAHLTRFIADLQAEYGFTSDDKGRMISEKPESSTIAKAMVKYKYIYAYHKAKGWTDEKFMRLSVLSAAWNDRVMSNHDVGILSPCVSRIALAAGRGWFLVNYPLMKAHGAYYGEGAQGEYYKDWNATILTPWIDNWLGDDRQLIACIMSTAFGLEGGSGYTEGGIVDGFGFIGNSKDGQWHDPSYQETGYLGWDDGEMTRQGMLRSNRMNGYGVTCVRGTPASFDQMSLFQNTLGAVLLKGTDLASIDLGRLSGDDNPAMIVMEAGYGRAAGGNVAFTIAKCESGKRNPNRGQIVVWQKDPCSGIIRGFFQMDMNGPYVDAAFVMNSRTDAQQQLFVQGRAWNYRTLVHDITNKCRWEGAQYRPCIFVWQSWGGGTLADLGTLQQVPKAVQNDSTVVNATDRLGMVENGGTFNYAAGTPKYSVTGGASTTPTTPQPPVVDPPVPPPVTPTPTPAPLTLVWKTAMGGTNKNVLAATTGNSAAALDAKWSGLQSLLSGLGSTHKNTKFPLTTADVRKVVLVDVTFPTLSDYKWLNDVLYTMANGTVYYRKGNAERRVATVTAGTKYARLELEFPPTDLGMVLGDRNNEGALMTLKGIELWS